MQKKLETKDELLRLKEEKEDELIGDKHCLERETEEQKALIQKLKQVEKDHLKLV